MFCAIAAIGCLLALATPGHAKPGDAAASAKIDEAINVHYLNTDFDQAEALLQETIKGCNTECSPAVIARAWMYVGVIRGSGREDMEGAREAFALAVSYHPEVALDEALATDPVRKVFEETRAAAGELAQPEQEQTGEAPSSPAIIGGMKCTPEVREVQTRRPIPISCTTNEPAVKAEIRYLKFGGDEWDTVRMTLTEGRWIGLIPCSATDIQGALLWYVNGKSSSGEVVDNYATQRQPVEITLLEATAEQPPAYPGRPPPERCGAAAECPKDMLGTPACPGTEKPAGAGGGERGWGASCSSTSQCQQGLYCLKGTCESAPSCEVDADCDSNKCVAFSCSMEGVEEGPAPDDGHPRFWLGAQFAADLALVSGREVCADDDAFACFTTDGAPYAGTPLPSAGGEIRSGFVAATLRLLLTFEYAVTRELGAEARLGLAFNGAPDHGNTTFMPFHGEARVKYWLGETKAGSIGLRPFAAIGGGLAQVDAKVLVDIQDEQGPGQLDAYKRLGTGFVAGAGGIMLAFAENHGVVANVELMYTFPNTALIVQPGIGYAAGF